MALAQIPFTKLVEDTMLEVRENSSETAVERKYQRRVNDIYARDLPTKFDFGFMRAASSVTISAVYSTGTVSGTSASTTITGASTVWVTGHTGWKMKINGNDEVYTFTWTNATSGTLSPALTATIAASTTYVLFQDTYSLASDYDRLVIPPGFYYDYGGSKVQISEKFNKDWYKGWTASSTLLPVSYRVFGRDSTNLYWQVQFSPPITTGKKISYEYYPSLADMTEYTTGTCATTAGDATITGTSTDFTNNVAAGDAFRMDSRPNDWYLVSSITTATGLELTANYPSTISTAADYTICKVPKLPVGLHLALFYGACGLSCQDQDDDSSAKNFLSLYEKTVVQFKVSENRQKFGRQRMTVKDMYRR